jgi:hypothetical protein
MATTTYAWWKQQPAVTAGTRVNVTLPTGAPDVEKGNIYNVPYGTPIAIPIRAKVAWEDSQRVILQIGNRFLNILHVNPDVPEGTVLKAGQPFAHPSTLVGVSAPDPKSGISYVEYPGPGHGIMEVGLYDTLQRAINRENFVGGRDMPYDFTGIANSDQLAKFFSSWKTGDGPEWTTVAPTGSNMNAMGFLGVTSGSNWTTWLLIGAAIIVLIVLLRR